MDTTAREYSGEVADSQDRERRRISEAQPGTARRWQKPELVAYGSVEEITAGSFSAPGDDFLTGSVTI